MTLIQTRENCADILCIGTQKASTSWLHHVLNAHPRTHSFPSSEPVTSTNKEAHFWDWNHDRGVAWYRELMTPDDPIKLSLDFTPEYSMLSEGQIAECKDLNPTARVIYVLRDPLARAISALRMHTKWRSQGARAEGVEIRYDQDFLELVARARIVEMSAYVANYVRWSKHYDDILVLNYEDILQDRHAVIARIHAHCGLETEALSPDAQAEFDKRMEKRVWVSTRYNVQSEALYFLHGLLWPKRQAAERFFGLAFEEYLDVLAEDR